MTTLLEIAKEAGVSINTVSRVLNGKLKGNYPAVVRKAERVRRIASKHGYRPNAAARAMVTRRTQQVGVLLPNTSDSRHMHPAAFELVLGVNEGLQHASYVMSLARLDDIRADLANQSRIFSEHLLDGMIVLGSMPAEVEQRIESLIPQVIWCDSNIWRPARCVRRDEYQAGQLAAEAALAGGYDRILMLTYRQINQHYSAQQRLAGAQDVLNLAGRSLRVVEEPHLGDSSERAELAAMLDENTAVICNSIYQAHALRSAAEENGKIPGRDFGMASCDDMHQLDRLWPGLARAGFERYEMGLAAAQMLLNVLDHDQPDCPSRIVASTWQPGQTLRQRP